MKQLIYKIILPLTAISFVVFTKWWYTFPVDAPDTMFYGFPLPYVGNGWHTSMSLQIFAAEAVIDLLSYFLFWLVIIFCIDQFITKIKLHKILIISIWTLGLLSICGFGLFASNQDNIFFVKRPFEIKVIETGYKFIWQTTKRP